MTAENNTCKTVDRQKKINPREREANKEYTIAPNKT